MTKVVRRPGHSHDEIDIHCSMGRLRFVVSVCSEDFTEKELKKAIALKLVSEFALLRARSMVGRSIPLEEVFREGEGQRPRRDFWDYF